MTFADLPTLNAGLNTLTFTLLLAAWWAIRRRRETLHRNLMVAATVTSAVFLASYLTYHYEVGSKRYLGGGWLRPLYFTILISHTILAMAVVPMVIRTLFLGWKGDRIRHRAIGRKTMPIWVYVSITGVIVYVMLYL